MTDRMRTGIVANLTAAVAGVLLCAGCSTVSSVLTTVGLTKPEASSSVRTAAQSDAPKPEPPPLAPVVLGPQADPAPFETGAVRQVVPAAQTATNEDDRPAGGSAGASPSRPDASPSGDGGLVSRGSGSPGGSPSHIAAPSREGAASAQVNIFGEFDGIERGLVKAAGEAGVQQHTFALEGYDGDVVVDPTGKWLAFVSTRHSENAHIYLQKVDGVSVIQLTEGAFDDAHPCFSPDGKRLAFCSTRSGNWDIYTMDIDGRNVTAITNSPAQEMHPSFAPDGNRLVYCSLPAKSDQWELWTVDLSSQEKRMIGHGLFPAWSPSKEADRIAFQKPRQRGSRWFGIWTLDLQDGEPRRLTELAASANAAVITPTWSADGQRIAFATAAEPAKINGARPQGRLDIWTMNADGTGRQRLTEGAATNLSPFWGVNNRIYFVSDRGGKENVWSIRAEMPRTFTASADDKGNEKPAGSNAVGGLDKE